MEHNAKEGAAHGWLDKLPIAVVLIIGIAVWASFKLTTGIALEDAYITYRYASNLASGTGFVYNAGERVLGTTTPLQTLLLAALGAAFGPDTIPFIASLLMPLFGLAAGLLAYSALVRFEVPRVGAAAGCLIFYLHPFVIRTSLGGMETPLMLFLMALSLWFLSRKSAVPAAAAAALLVLCRVDGLIWAGLLLGASLLTNYRRPGRQLVVFAAILAPWLLFAFLYFGSPIPNTVLAKGVVRPGRERQLLDLVHAGKYFRWFVSGTGFGTGQPLFPAWAGLMFLGAWSALRRRRVELAILVVFPILYAVLLYFGRAPRYPWYLLPITLCCVFLGGVGLGSVVSVVRRWQLDWRLRVAFAVCALAVAVPGLIGLADRLPRVVRHTRLFQENEDGLRKAVGLWLRRATPPDATVAMEAVGYQGYFSKRRVVDMAGLITPQVVRFKASTGSNGRIFKLITTQLVPDYIVLRWFEVDQNRHFNGGKLFETAADRSRFFATYKEAKRFIAPHPELAPLITRLTVYERKKPPGR